MLRQKDNMMKKRSKFIIVFLFLIFSLFFYLSCTTTKNQQKSTEESNQDPFQIFTNSLITSNNSSYYIYKNKANIFILEKVMNLQFLYDYLKSYSKPINQYVNLNKFSKKKIEDEPIKILLYETLDKPFNNLDPILNFIFDKNSMRLNDNNITFRIQKWGGVFDYPDLIIMNMNNYKNNQEYKIHYISTLFHEYLHYLFEIKYKDYLHKSYFSSNEENYLPYYYSFLTEMFSYYNHICLAYFMVTDDTVKLTEEKVMMATRKFTQNVVLSRASKDPVMLAMNYQGGNTSVVYYLIDFANFLIKYKDFDTFLKLLQSIFSGDTNDLDQVFQSIYNLNLKQLFDLWKTF